MVDMIEDIVKKLEKLYDVEVEVEYDYRPVNTGSIIEMITHHIRDEDTPPITSGDCWVVRFGSDLDIILLKRGVVLRLENFYDSLSETKIEDEAK